MFIGDQEIIQGNCLEVLTHPGFAPVDVVVTSPPYNLNMAYGVYEKSRCDSTSVSLSSMNAASGHFCLS